ncbi:MAG TPA: hypothetical protein VJT54_02210 [Verrucomicrobiae bacterium]|nr:hypothetical protein [Verrucomicrobiae bacterium]
MLAQNGAPPAGGQTPAIGPGTNNVKAALRWRPDLFRRFFGPTTPFETPGIGLKPFVIDHRHATHSVIDLSFLLDAPAGKHGFIRARGDQLVKGDSGPIRFWGFNVTEWSHGSTEVPAKADAPLWAEALARAGVNMVRLQFLDLAAPRGLIDGTRNDSQHFDPAQLDNEDFFLAELMKRGIYIDFNLNVGRAFKPGDNVPALREGKGPLLFDRRLIELEKDYARQLLTHVNPYTKRAYVDDPGVAIVEIVNEDAIGVGWKGNKAYDDELTDLFNGWLLKNVSTEKLAEFRKAAGVGPDQPIPRLTGPAVPSAAPDRYYAECRFYSELESGFFKEMSSYLRADLGVKCALIATADHSHSGSGYPLEADAQQLDIMDGHDYWRHPGVPPFRHNPMVNEPFNSTVVELSRTAIAGKPYTVSEVNNPWPNQFDCEGIPILAAYGDFQGWNGIMWYTFEPKRNADWQPVLTDPFDMSHDPVKMPEMAAGALMFLRGDIEPARKTVARSYTPQEVRDSRRLAGMDRPYFTPGFPLSLPLLHASRIQSLDGQPTARITADLASPCRSDTGQLTWYTNPVDKGLVTIDSPCSQALVGFVKANGKSVSNLSADVSNTFCAIILSSLEAKPISTSSRMLLVTGSRVENTGMTWNAEKSLPANWGGTPTVIEPVTGTITLRDLARANAVSARALDGSGRPIGDPIIAQKTGVGWEIAVGQIVTPWYELTVERSRR